MTPTDPNTHDPTEATTPPPAAPAVDLMSEPTFEECIIARNEYHELLMAGQFNDVKIPVNNYFAY